MRPKATAAGFFFLTGFLAGGGVDSPVALSTMARASWLKSLAGFFLRERFGMLPLCEIVVEKTTPTIVTSQLSLDCGLRRDSNPHLPLSKRGALST